MKVLLIGGTGTISTGVEKVVIEERGYELYVLNRGSQRSLERMHPEAHLLKADYTDQDSARAARGDRHFDTIVDFRIQGVADQEKAVRLFDGKTDQYILISSGTVYRKPLEKYLVTEDMPLGNYHSKYARNKVASEMTLRKYIEKGFPGSTS